MSMTKHVVGFRLPDAKYRKMEAAWNSCTRAGVSIPKEVGDYFSWETPDPQGQVISLKELDCCRDYNAEMIDGFEIDISKLPPGVTIVRFYNSY